MYYNIKMTEENNKTEYQKKSCIELITLCKNKIK